MRTRVSATRVLCGVIFLAMGGMIGGSFEGVSYAQENCAECITPQNPVLSTPLESFLGKISCGYEPILASTAIKKSILPRLLAQGMSGVLPKMSQGIQSKPLRVAPIALKLPPPDQLKYVLPFAKYAAQYGDDVVKIIENMESGDLEKLCSQEDKKICYAILALRKAKQIRGDLEKVRGKAREAMEQLKKNCQQMEQRWLPAIQVCGDPEQQPPATSPQPGSGQSPAVAPSDSENQLTQFLKSFLVPYEATPRNTRLSRFNLSKMNVVADPRRPNLYYAQIAVDEIRVDGNLDVATTTPPSESIIQNSSWNLQLKPGRKVYVTVPLQSKKQADGSYRFSIIPGTTRVQIKNEDFLVESRSDPNRTTPASQALDELVPILSQELLSDHSDLISQRVSEVVAEKTSQGLTPVVDRLQERIIIRHPMLPASVQRAVFESMAEKEKQNLAAMETGQDNEDQLRDRIVRSQSFLRNMGLLMDSTPELVDEMREFLDQYRSQVEKLVTDSRNNGGDELSWRRKLARMANIPFDYARTRTELLQKLQEQSERLKNKADQRSFSIFSKFQNALHESAYGTQEQRSSGTTQLRFFEDPKRPDYLFLGVATCPGQGAFLEEEGEHPVEFVQPIADSQEKPDFSVAVTADSINSYLRRMFDNGLLDASVTGNESIRSVRFLSEPKIEVDSDGKMTIRINAAFDQKNVPNLFTNNVDVKLEVRVGLSPDQKNLQITPTSTSVQLNVQERKIQTYLSEWLLKVPANLFLPALQPSQQQWGERLNQGAKIPDRVNQEVKNLRLETQKGRIFLSGDLR